MFSQSLHRQLVSDIGWYLKSLEGSLPRFGIGINVATAKNYEKFYLQILCYICLVLSFEVLYGSFLSFDV